MDYGKFKYEAAQRAKESRRRTTQISIKEMKYRPKIGVGDFDTKTKRVASFLEEGHKVKLTIMFRGREVHHPELGMQILERVADQTANIAKVEASPRLDGRNMTMVLAPDRRAQAAHRSEGGADDDATSAAPEAGAAPAPRVRPNSPRTVPARSPGSGPGRPSGSNGAPSGPSAAPPAAAPPARPAAPAAAPRPAPASVASRPDEAGPPPAQENER
jgi:translation initiation factor IF-3